MAGREEVEKEVLTLLISVVVVVLVVRGLYPGLRMMMAT